MCLKFTFQFKKELSHSRMQNAIWDRYFVETVGPGRSSGLIIPLGTCKAFIIVKILQSLPLFCCTEYTLSDEDHFRGHCSVEKSYFSAIDSAKVIKWSRRSWEALLWCKESYNRSMGDLFVIIIFLSWCIMGITKRISLVCTFHTMDIKESESIAGFLKLFDFYFRNSVKDKNRELI